LRLGIIDGVEDLGEVDLGVFLLELLELLPRRVVGRDSDDPLARWIMKVTT